jgi:hypothetical protein
MQSRKLVLFRFKGSSGGILMMWDMRVGEFTISSSFRNVEDQFSWAFASAYGPNIDGDIRLLWDELACLLGWWNLPWCIGGSSMFLVFLVKDRVKPASAQLWWSFWTSFFSRGLWVFP